MPRLYTIFKNIPMVYKDMYSRDSSHFGKKDFNEILLEPRDCHRVLQQEQSFCLKLHFNEGGRKAYKDESDYSDYNLCSLFMQLYFNEILLEPRDCQRGLQQQQSFCLKPYFYPGGRKAYKDESDCPDYNL